MPAIEIALQRHQPSELLAFIVAQGFPEKCRVLAILVDFEVAIGVPFGMKRSEMCSTLD